MARISRKPRKCAFCNRVVERCWLNLMIRGPICMTCKTISEETNSLCCIRSRIEGRFTEAGPVQSESGFTWSANEADRIAHRVADRLPSMKRAAFWHRMYRHDLYRQTPYREQLRTKLDAAREAALDDIRALKDKYKIDGIRLYDLKNWRGLEWSVSDWNETPDTIEARSRRAHRRMDWWHGRWLKDGSAEAEKWHMHWRFIYVAIDLPVRGGLGLRSWPLSERDVERTKKFIQSEFDNDVMERVRAEVRREKEQAEAIAVEKRRKLEVKREARDMVAEIVPGARSRRLMSKAHGFDALVKLLEGSHVDDTTKAAIVRLREAVEGERAASRGLSAQPSPAAGDGNRRGNPKRGGQGVSGVDG